MTFIVATLFLKIMTSMQPATTTFPFRTQQQKLLKLPFYEFFIVLEIIEILSSKQGERMIQMVFVVLILNAMKTNLGHGLVSFSCLLFHFDRW